ncbi:MAG TPA: DJ-1/PfpI family protein [Chthoniobacterales bacterium]|nr:DJ-1/PfpI family protein [Chthoniobacterales bacterium]
MNKIRVGILGYDGVAAINVVGPLEAFSNAFRLTGPAKALPCYEVLIVGCSGETFITDTGVTLNARSWSADQSPLDTVIIPGGAGMRNNDAVTQVGDWIRANAGNIRRIASVCTGVYGLASTGLLDGRRVTTHWQNAADVAARFPQLEVEESAIVVKDGQFYSAAGATAGIDLALFLIAEDFGRDVAVAVARKLLVYVQREGGQEQYSEPNRLQIRNRVKPGRVNGKRMNRLVGWMNKHLGEDLRLETLAKRVLLSKTEFVHEFTGAFGVPPALFVKNLRFNEARRRLMSGERAAAVARSVGFHDAAYFIQEFRRRYGMLPSDYQHRFDWLGGGSVPSGRKRFAKRRDEVINTPNRRGRPQITSFTRCVRRHVAIEASIE